MKRLLQYLAFGLLSLSAAAALSSSSCGGASSNDPEVVPELSTDKEELAASYEATELTVNVTANCEWGVSSGATDWCTVSPSGGLSGSSTVKVSLTENFTRDARETVLTFRFGSARKTMNVKQECKEDGVNIPAGYKLVWTSSTQAAHPHLIPTNGGTRPEAVVGATTSFRTMSLTGCTMA